MEYHGGKNLDGKPKITMLDVWEGRASQTAGGLKKFDLMINKKNRVVSRRKHELGIRNFTGFRAKLCDGDFDLSKFKPTYTNKYMPKKKQPPVLTIKEKVKKMLSVRKTEAEMADTYRRFRERFKDIIEPAEKRERAIERARKAQADPNRKLTTSQWVDRQIEAMAKTDKWQVLGTLKKGDRIIIVYNGDYIVGTVSNPNIRRRTAEGVEDHLKITIKTFNGKKPDPDNYKVKEYKKGILKDEIAKIVKYADEISKY